MLFTISYKAKTDRAPIQLEALDDWSEEWSLRGLQLHVVYEADKVVLYAYGDGVVGGEFQAHASERAGAVFTPVLRH